MKNLILVTTLIFSIGILAQSTPRAPETPKNNTTSKSYSVHIDDDNDFTRSSSVSVKKSDNSYKFRASFHNSKTEKVKKIILDRLGKENIIVKKDTYLWNRIVNNKEVFGCRLSKGHLKIFINKDDVSTGFYNKIDSLGEELKHVISVSSNRKHAKKDAEHAKRDLERAERDLERAERDLERAKKDLERAKKKN